MKQYVFVFALITFLILILLFPAGALTGAGNGLLLWFQIIIPTLLPFLILSNLLIHSNSTTFISKICNPLFKKLFRVSDEASYAIIIGFLCGYPMGAKVITDLILSNRISKEEGQYLLSFCNNASPMFVISYVVTQSFSDQSLLAPTLIILYVTPLFCSFAFRKFYHFDTSTTGYYKKTKIHISFQIFDISIMNGFETITKIGGYIILFSILFNFCLNFPFAWFIPLLEISNGIIYIMNMSIPFIFIYCYVLGLTSFGGFCAIAQTHSMIQVAGLRIRPYIIQKLITALVTSLLAFIYINFIHR